MKIYEEWDDIPHDTLKLRSEWKTLGRQIKDDAKYGAVRRWWNDDASCYDDFPLYDEANTL